MQEVRLEDVLALGEQLAALDEAGAPLALGFPRPIRPAIQRVGAEIARRTGAGASLAEIVAGSDLNAPEGYRRLLSEWIASGDLADALESRRELGSQKQSFERRMTLGLFYPALVAILAAFGVAGMARWLLPVFESTYQQLNEPVSESVARLQWLRASTPVWLALTVLVTLLGVAWLRRPPAMQWTSRSRHLGPSSRNRLARASEDAAELIDAGVTPPEALRLAGVEDAAGGNVAKLAPLLVWAGRSGSASDLRAVGSVYDNLARLGVNRFTTYAPLLAVVVIGGGAVLLYSLSLFLPIVELLERLAG